MVQLIVSGQISQIGPTAQKVAEAVFRREKDPFCCYLEMGAELVVEIPEKKEDAMNSNVHVCPDQQLSL